MQESDSIENKTKKWGNKKYDIFMLHCMLELGFGLLVKKNLADNYNTPQCEIWEQCEMQSSWSHSCCVSGSDHVISERTTACATLALSRSASLLPSVSRMASVYRPPPHTFTTLSSFAFLIALSHVSSVSSSSAWLQPGRRWQYMATGVGT